MSDVCSYFNLSGIRKPLVECFKCVAGKVEPRC